MVSINPEDGEKVNYKFEGKSAYNSQHKGKQNSKQSQPKNCKPVDSLFCLKQFKMLEKKSSTKKDFDKKSIKTCKF